MFDNFFVFLYGDFARMVRVFRSKLIQGVLMSSWRRLEMKLLIGSGGSAFMLLVLWVFSPASASSCLPSPTGGTYVGTPCVKDQAKCDKDCSELEVPGDNCRCCMTVREEGFCVSYCKLNTMTCGCGAENGLNDDPPVILTSVSTAPHYTLNEVYTVSMPDRSMEPDGGCRNTGYYDLAAGGYSVVGVVDATLACDSRENTPNNFGNGAWKPWAQGTKPRVVIADGQVRFRSNWAEGALPVNPSDDTEMPNMKCRYQHPLTGMVWEIEVDFTTSTAVF